ncbi:DUF433 domain-containing protein [Patescibacteria group bacterium]|nr:DUF433 domain-containing protein [Patescibacteria group bacterium]MBU4512334.1 DUF433 domain-containing protein [Patescibacteria group bacterium]
MKNTLKNLKKIREKRVGKLKNFTKEERIEINPEIVLGKPVIRGTRLTVEYVLKLLGQGIKPEEILKGYPQLEKEDIEAVLDYAFKRVSEEKIFPLTLQVQNNYENSIGRKHFAPNFQSVNKERARS